MPESKNHAAVLLVEDHQELAKTVISYLEMGEFIVDYAADGLSALHLASVNQYDVIVLDVMLPGLNGFDVCKKLRRDARLSTPIIMLTARDQLNDKLEGFDSGADDYLIKPFDLAELEARLNSIIRRVRGEMELPVYTISDLTFDTQTKQVKRAGKTIKLSPTCMRILQVLMRDSPKMISRAALERELWGDMLPDSDTLRSHLYNLRKAIDKPFKEQLMETIPGVGFRISKEATDD